MSNSSKKAFGFYVLLFAAILSLAAGLYFYSIHGTFGLDSTHNGVCYDPIVLGLLIGGAIAVVVLILLKKYGLASAVAAAAPGVAICFFVHKCYWYVVDPRFITFCALAAAAFLIGEIAVYVRKTKASV